MATYDMTDIQENVDSTVEVIAQPKDNYLEQMIKRKMQDDLFSNNQYEQIIKDRTKNEFINYLNVKERLNEEQALKNLESKGIVTVDWRNYHGHQSDEDLELEAKVNRFLKACTGVGILVAAIIAIFWVRNHSFFVF